MDQENALELFDVIQCHSPYHQYRLRHVKLARDYMLELNHRLEYGLDEEKITTIALLHDIMKERGNQKEDIYIESHLVPVDLNDYVRRNLRILAEYELDDYFNSDVQLHPLAGGIFLRKEFYIDDPEILFPIFFHSCPVMSVYREVLSVRMQRYVDLMMLSDKLSSNWLRINAEDGLILNHSKEAPVDLDLLVFGPDGKELNFTLGLVVAKMLGNSKHQDLISTEATQFYHERLLEINPLLINLKLGGKRIWARRRNQSLVEKRKSLYSGIK